LTLGIAGCTTVGPDFVQPKAPVIEQWQEADGAVVTSKPAEQIRWWEAFSDPVLDKLIDVAYQNNYSLKIAGLKVLEARAQLGIAVGYLYPQVQQATGSVNYKAGSKNAANTKAGDLGFLEYNVGVSVGWELDFWGKFRRSIESADSNLLASVAGYDNALVLLVAQVADTCFAIRTAEAQLKVARDNVAIQQRAVQITEARFRGGDVGELDVLQARTQLLGTLATIPPLETGLRPACPRRRIGSHRPLLAIRLIRGLAALSPRISHRIRGNPESTSSPSPTTPSRPACCLPPKRRRRSTRSTSSGTATRWGACSSRRTGRRRSAAYACASCSTTPIPAGSTLRSLRSAHNRTSRFVYTTRSRSAGRAPSAT
jgi:hypothetical protein